MASHRSEYADVLLRLNCRKKLFCKPYIFFTQRKMKRKRNEKKIITIEWIYLCISSILNGRWMNRHTKVQKRKNTYFIFILYVRLSIVHNNGNVHLYVEIWVSIVFAADSIEWFKPNALNNNFVGIYRYGRSPECVRMCVVTLELCENLRSQIGQRNGFWPV